MSKPFRRVLHTLHEIFPAACLLCGKTVHRHIDLCRDCEAALPYNRPACLCCGSPAAEGVPTMRCGFCLGHRWPVESCTTLLRYEGAAADLVTRFKYQSSLASGRTLSLLLAEYLKNTWAGGPFPELLIPVPLHWRRLFARGFNQSLEVAKVLARELELPLDQRCCRRVRPTARQVGLDEEQRRQNLQGAFHCDFGAAAVPGRVAIVDDVLTSGATATALATLLQEAGSQVHLWCLARA